MQRRGRGGILYYVGQDKPYLTLNIERPSNNQISKCQSTVSKMHPIAWKPFVPTYYGQQGGGPFFPSRPICSQGLCASLMLKGFVRVMLKVCVYHVKQIACFRSFGSDILVAAHTRMHIYFRVLENVTTTIVSNEQYYAKMSDQTSNGCRRRAPNRSTRDKI